MLKGNIQGHSVELALLRHLAKCAVSGSVPRHDVGVQCTDCSTKLETSIICAPTILIRTFDYRASAIDRDFDFFLQNG